MPETDAKQIKQLNEKAILLGTHHFSEIPKLIRKYKEDKLDWVEQNKFLDYKCSEKEQKAKTKIFFLHFLLFRQKMT